MYCIEIEPRSLWLEVGTRHLNYGMAHMCMICEGLIFCIVGMDQKVTTEGLIFCIVCMAQKVTTNIWKSELPLVSLEQD
jgi:hypothetical protein